MQSSLVVFFVLLFVNFSESEHLPSSFKKCNRKQEDFNQCLATALEDALSQLTTPFPEVGLPSLDPFSFPNLTTPAGNNAFLFPQVYKNFDIYGYTNGKVSKFDFSFENKTVFIIVSFPELRVEFQYDFQGKALLVPVRGKGPGKYTVYEVPYWVTFNLEEYEKDGQKHYKVVSGDVIFKEPKEIIFKFSNLSRLDSLLGLGDVLDPNVLFNKSWKQVFYDIKRGYEEWLSEEFGKLFNNLLEKVPISELFDNQ